jgi:hypothetical protein
VFREDFCLDLGSERGNVVANLSFRLLALEPLHSRRIAVRAAYDLLVIGRIELLAMHGADERLLGLANRLRGKARFRIVPGEGEKLLVDLLELRGCELLHFMPRCRTRVFEKIRGCASVSASQLTSCAGVPALRFRKLPLEVGYLLRVTLDLLLLGVKGLLRDHSLALPPCPMLVLLLLAFAFRDLRYLFLLYCLGRSTLFPDKIVLVRHLWFS